MVSLFWLTEKEKNGEKQQLFPVACQTTNWEFVKNDQQWQDYISTTVRSPSSSSSVFKHLRDMAHLAISWTLN